MQFSSLTKPAGFIVMCLSLLSLNACTEQKKPSHDYRLRLANVLNLSETSPAKDSNTEGLRFPKVRELRESPDAKATQTISIREFLGLRQCKLHLAIAERNSSLGRVAKPSQRLNNDLKILNTGPDCLAKLGQTKLKKQLAVYLENKRSDLPRVLWHALLGEAEYRSMWNTSSQITNYPSTLPSNTVVDDLRLIIMFVDRVLTGQYKAAQDGFNLLEEALGRLRYADAGYLFHELNELHFNLSQADKLIEQRLTTKLCLNQRPTPSARYFQNVVNTIFIEKVQVRSISLLQRHKQIMPLINELETRLAGHKNAEFYQWQARRNTQLKLSLNATLKHAKNIKQLYQQCGLQAGLKPSYDS